MAKKTLKALPRDNEEVEMARAFPRKFTEKLRAYEESLLNPDIKLILVEGLPHTGKTLNAVEKGIQQVLDGKYNKLIFIRPVVELAFGYLPGTMEDKMALYNRQAREYVNGASMEGWINLSLDKKIEILPADQLQGNHFPNSFIILDESQNIHENETFKILSRIGDGCKYVVIGDTSTGQENRKVKSKNMLAYAINKFTEYNHPSIAVHTFYDADNDILGDSFTRFIIKTLMKDFVK